MLTHGLLSAGIPNQIGHAIGYLRQWLPLSTSTSRFPGTRMLLRPKHTGYCMWQRVARQRWSDYMLGSLGWYPWQCKRCHIRSYFRLRF